MTWRDHYPGRTLDELLRDRVIVVSGVINERLANETIAKLLFLASEGSTRITLAVDSPGGSVALAFAIMDVIEELGCPVRTQALDRVEGMAVSIVAHGTRGHRITAHDSTFGLVPLAGDGPDVARTAWLVVQRLAADTDRPVDDIAAALRSGQRFDATQARTFGLVDWIV